MNPTTLHATVIGPGHEGTVVALDEGGTLTLGPMLTRKGWPAGTRVELAGRWLPPREPGGEKRFDVGGFELV